MAKLKNRLNPETEMSQIGAELRAQRPAKIIDVEVLLPALEGCEDEFRKRVDATGPAMLNDATRNAIATEMKLAGRQSCQLEVAEPTNV